MILKHKILALLGIACQIEATQGISRFNKNIINQSNNINQAEIHPIHWGHLGISTASAGISTTHLLQSNNNYNNKNELTDDNQNKIIRAMVKEQLKELYQKHDNESETEISEKNTTQYSNENTIAGAHFLTNPNKNKIRRPLLDIPRLNTEYALEDYNERNIRASKKEIKQKLANIYEDVNESDKGFFGDRITKDKSKRVLENLNNEIKSIIKHNIDPNTELDTNSEQSLLYQMLLILELAITRSDSFTRRAKIELVWYENAQNIFAFICNNCDSKDSRIINKLTNIVKCFLDTNVFINNNTEAIRFKFDGVYNSSLILAILRNFETIVATVGQVSKVVELIDNYLSYVLNNPSERRKEIVIKNEQILDFKQFSAYIDREKEQFINYLSMIMLCQYHSDAVVTTYKANNQISTICKAFEGKLTYFYELIKEEKLFYEAQLRVVENENKGIDRQKLLHMRSRIEELTKYMSYMNSTIKLYQQNDGHPIELFYKEIHDLGFTLDF